MVDCHSFSMSRSPRGSAAAGAIRPGLVRRTRERTDETLEIRQSIRQPMAGGEVLWYERIRAALPERSGPSDHAGRQTLRRAARIDPDCRDGRWGIPVAPHNPSGPYRRPPASSVRRNANSGCWNCSGEKCRGARIWSPPHGSASRGIDSVSDRPAGSAIQLNPQPAPIRSDSYRRSASYRPVLENGARHFRVKRKRPGCSAANRRPRCTIRKCGCPPAESRR